jgi:16S rRNA (guanine966-N2)-methyltransferase
MIEQDRRTAALINANAKDLGFAKADVRIGPVAGALHTPPAAPYDIAFMDPPYPLDGAAVDADLDALNANAWLVPGALVVIERSSRSPEPTWPEGVVPMRSRRYGETVLWYGHAANGTED